LALAETITSQQHTAQGPCAAAAFYIQASKPIIFTYTIVLLTHCKCSQKIRTFWYFRSDIKNEFEHFFSLEMKKIRDDNDGASLSIMDNNLSAFKDMAGGQ